MSAIFYLTIFLFFDVFANWYSVRASWVMGYRDLDLWFFWFGVSCAKGSATAQPPEIPAFHVSPRCLYPLVYQSTSTFSSNFYNNNNNTNNNKTDLLLSKTCMSFILDLHPSTRGTVSRLSNHTSKTLNLHLLGRRHTDKIFGRDTAANPATVHLDSLSVPRPCQFPPIQTHGRLRADSIRGQGPGFWSA